MSDETFADAVLASLDAAAMYNAGDREAPRAILWPDPERAWGKLLPAIAARRRVLQLGERSEGDGTGPAIWIRWKLLETDGASLPIIYLPGVDRTEIRAVESTPAAIRPLADLQFRSSWWQHSNGSAWTPAGFARSPEGARLDVAKDAATKDAWVHALDQVGAMTMVALRARGQLGASFLQDLLIGDPIRLLLDWINDPSSLSQRSASERAAFVGMSKSKLGFNPETDGEIEAARRLGERSGEWAIAWQRFTESPATYPRIPERLEQAKPTDTLFVKHLDSWPQDNRSAEDELRAALLSLDALPISKARERIKALAEEHRPRTYSVWASLGFAPLARAVVNLGTVAHISSKPAPSGSLGEVVGWYTSSGANADDSVLRAIAEVPDASDRKAVVTAIQMIYRDWSDENAKTFQSLLVGTPPAPRISTAAGECVLFVDGLRYDVGRRLASALESGGSLVDLTHRWAAVPSMTSSGKPAVAPITVEMSGGSDFYPAVDGKNVDSTRLRQLMSNEGVECIAESDIGEPSGRGWTESADLDARGHKLKLKLADAIDAEVTGIANRVRELLAGGWNRVHVVTDHGWLLMPGSLPKSEFPIQLAELKKTRSARIATHAGQVPAPEFRFTWDSEVRVASPPGIHAFEKGCIYEHGGVSPQESVTPYLVVTEAPDEITAAVVAVSWAGLRAKVTVVAPPDATVQIRTKPASADSAITKAVTASSENQASLLVSDDNFIGHAAAVVVLGTSGELLTQLSIVVGG